MLLDFVFQTWGIPTLITDHAHNFMNHYEKLNKASHFLKNYTILTNHTSVELKTNDIQ